MSSTIQPFTGATVNDVGEAIVKPVNSKTPVEEFTVEMFAGHADACASALPPAAGSFSR